MHEAVDIALILRWREWHVAIGALGRLGRVVERAGALSRNTAGLPVIVLVEAANPAIVVHWDIKMDFVTAGTELGRLVAHERF